MPVIGPAASTVANKPKRQDFLFDKFMKSPLNIGAIKSRKSNGPALLRVVVSARYYLTTQDVRTHPEAVAHNAAAHISKLLPEQAGAFLFIRLRKQTENPARKSAQQTLDNNPYPDPMKLPSKE